MYVREGLTELRNVVVAGGFLCCVASTGRLHRLHTVQAVCDGVMLSGTLASSISAHHSLGTCHVCLLGVMAEIGCWPTCLAAGAGAAAAANDAAGYFKYELLRRVVMEFVMPWVTLSLSARRHKAQKRKAI
jgi:hypothetical protein